ncbi:hypothetical protein CkaCkLH20_03187 [Colletotrichum karsti]|uniref:FAS1 domain-containing protein n=1 Tax=Colletotrichum karsti TaxID=1095194 RepID=A0A9P6LKQ5_9PEZI|nr:uncharacterized protein CkaCkLH20_03187 [Colletotrichum karsti]KAF9879644.1 hypothetical protein CkaCkLH20_03187 [Colletotrichum karsti]
MQLKGFLPLAFAALAAAAEPLAAVLKTHNASLSTFNAMLAMVPAISQSLATSKDFTILAPSDDAFVKAMQLDPTFAQKATNVTFVTDLLMYHVVTGKTTSSAFSSKPKFAATMFETPFANVTGTQKVELAKMAGKAVVFSGYKQMSIVSTPDISFTGGVLHVLDSVLTFPGTPAETALNSGLTSMAGALTKAGLVDGVNSLQAATVFAPTNAAFQAIGLTAAQMQPQDLAKILQYHVVTNQVRFSSGITTKMGFKSLMGEKVTLRKEQGSVFANSARVTVSDIITSDGVMHVIDSVLNPAQPKLTPQTSSATSPSAFNGAVSAANAPFAELVRPTANFVLAVTSSARTVKISLGSAVLGFLGCLAVVMLDLHFKHHDLDRVRQTAQWIVAEAERYQVGRVVVCGDLLTSRTTQSTHVLSACYRFISLLSDVVPRVHILLGNHDLAYRRDYETTALDAFNMKRLAPYVSLHSAVTRCEWDGRSVLLLPFREEQNELTDAVAALDPSEASHTVAFAHLAINKAITQRCVVSPDVRKPRAVNSVTYHGFTGPDRFAALARTFTGHFHSHQTITQKNCSSNTVNLQGSVTYLGSPLQLSWADLQDEQRGVVLFDPETLEHELLINPHAVGYRTADLQQVLDGEIEESDMTDKHVMLLGKLTHLKYVTARDKLLSLGVRSVRPWTPSGFALQNERLSSGGLGASVPASDLNLQHLGEPTERGECPGTITPTDGITGTDSDGEPRAERLDMSTEAREYVESLDLDESLLSRRDELVRVGQRIIQRSRDIADEDDEAEIAYEDFLDSSSQASGTRTANKVTDLCADVFVAEPLTLTITNFLAVQDTTTVDFREDIKRGLNFLVGDNGSGKSTLIEAMVWCQFGQCLRGGLAVNDVVNDKAGKNCSVVLEFANGYSIARYRKHKTYKNRVVVSLHGEPQLQLEHPDARTTQAAINELLGTDYETYVRTIVLSQESAAGLLNSTPAQRRELIESSLGLSILDDCGRASRLLLKKVDTEVSEVTSKSNSLLRTVEYHERHLHDLSRTYRRIEAEAEEAVITFQAADRDFSEKRGQRFEPDMSIRSKISELQSQIRTEEEDLQRLKGLFDRTRAKALQEKALQEKARQEKAHARARSWPDWLHRQLDQRLEKVASAHPTSWRKFLQSIELMALHLLSATLRSLGVVPRVPKDSPCEGSDHIRDQEHEATIRSLLQDIDHITSRLESLKQEESVSVNHLVTMNEQFEQTMRTQKALDALQQEVIRKQTDAATYKALAEKAQLSLHILHSEHDELTVKLGELAANRELFAFWSSTLAKRSRGASSSSSSTSAATTANSFREQILQKSLGELNVLLAKVLTTLYDDTWHARMATGVLQSLFDSESADETTDTSLSGSVLGPNLAVRSSLAYSKRSSGERKRVDLALFFALLQLSRARSAHRAHYVLVDEVFDNLDKQGTAAVVKWCGVMSQTVVRWMIVITHNQVLVGQDLEQYVGRAVIAEARMGQGGTESAAIKIVPSPTKLNAIMSSSLYTQLPLAHPDRQIRLLRPEPPSPDHDDPIFSLAVHDFDENSYPQYIAISYTWGLPVPLLPIVVNGHKVKVHLNCWYALWQMRYHGYTNENFWIDSICINQCDNHEKAVQVSMMGAIFSSAQWVASCVGTGDKIGSLRKILEAGDSRAIVKAGGELDELPYFERVWILQEMFLARDITLAASCSASSFKNLTFDTLTQGTNHDLVTRRYLDFHGLTGTSTITFYDSFYDAVAALKNDTLDHVLMNAVHPEAPSIVGSAFRTVFVVDAFISPSKPLVVATRRDAADPPRSVAVLYPAVANYTDTSRWPDVVRVTSGGLVQIARDLVEGVYDSAIIYRDTALANADVLRIDEELGSPDDAWLLLGRSRTYTNSVLAWPDAPVTWQWKKQWY